jgi:hypothetical protein
MPVPPIQPILKSVMKYMKENPQQAAVIIGAVTAGLKKLPETTKDLLEKQRSIKKEKLETGGASYRKNRLNKYRSKFLNELPDMKKKELFFHLLETEDMVESIKGDINKTGKANPALLLKQELKTWEAIQLAIANTMDTLDYEELLMHYHNDEYKGDYFEGFDLMIENLHKYKESDKRKLHLYIKEVTNKNMTKIERDFL